MIVMQIKFTFNYYRGTRTPKKYYINNIATYFINGLRLSSVFVIKKI